MNPHDKAKQEHNCKGLIYRARINNYSSNGIIGIKTTFSKLKKKSCPGCQVCAWIEDQLSEQLDYGCVIIPRSLKVKDQSLYELKITNMDTDYETGYADSWDLEFIYIKNQ